MFNNFDEILREIESIENGSIKTKKEMKVKLVLIRDTLSVLVLAIEWPDLKIRSETLGQTDPEERWNIDADDVAHVCGIANEMLGGVSLETFFGIDDLSKMLGLIRKAYRDVLSLHVRKKIKLNFANQFLK